MNTLTYLDLFFRFSTVGVLAFICINGFGSYTALARWVARSLLACLSGYLLLTAPIANSDYGMLRGLFLFLTELLPYVLWCHTFLIINPKLSIKDIPIWGLIAALSLVLGFLLFFLVYQGKGVFHEINHVIGIAIVSHIVVMCLSGLQDDMVDQRRKLRIFVATFFGSYSAFLATLEIVDFAWRDDGIFTTANAFVIFLIVLLLPKFLYDVSQDTEEEKSSDVPQAATIPAVYKKEYEKLISLMESGYFRRQNITVKIMSDDIAIPEHRLRTLINKHLKFDNFSAFLNHYRIPAACQALSDESKARESILNIALDSGFASIGPFNRAFKQAQNIQPSEYRKQLHNQ